MAFVDATIFRHIEVLQMYIPVLEKLCLYDYRSIIVPLLKSFLQVMLYALFSCPDCSIFDVFELNFFFSRHNWKICLTRTLQRSMKHF